MLQFSTSSSHPPWFWHPEEGLRHSGLSGNQGLPEPVQSRTLRRDPGMAFSVAFLSLGASEVALAEDNPGRLSSARSPGLGARRVRGRESGRAGGRARGEGGGRGRDDVARLPQGRPMAPPRPPRLVPALRALLYWSLVYGYCGLCASVHLLKLLWSIGKAPAQTFRRAARANPPACLNDPSLGTHCYVRIKVKAGARGGRGGSVTPVGAAGAKGAGLILPKCVLATRTHCGLRGDPRGGRDRAGD